MALVYEQNWSSPTSNAKIYIDVGRNGANIEVYATVVCTLTYSSGFINYDGEINFNMWHGGASASTNIKGYYDRWAKNTDRTRTRTCSMSFTDIGSSFDIGFNMTIPSSRPAGAAFRISDQYRTLGAPSYNAPSQPTWINITPNPCDIDNRPLITWGGANAGTLGRLYYDVEVKTTRQNGSWTDWLRIANAQSATFYQEIALRGMNVYGQRPFVGVKYKYRVRSSDGSYLTSGWIETADLNVSFINPTAPANYVLSDNSIKKDGTIQISWSGASGGSGNISSYQLDYRIYNHRTSTWTNWNTIYNGTNSSYDFSIADYYEDASNGDLLQFRIRTYNSWGQWSSYKTTISITIRGNQMWIKINGSWKEGDTYLKVNGSWKEATPYIKVNGSWKETS
jgi:hypothetical protein